MTWSRKLAVAASAVALVSAAGCAGGSSQGASGGSAQDSSAGSAAPAVNITSPQNGAKVSSSFPLTFKSSVPIGPLESGEDHVHVIIDGNLNSYTVVTAKNYMVKNLSPGKHTVGITLQHADHSPAGAQDQVTVMVAKGMKSGAKEDNPARTKDDNGTMNNGSTSGNSSSSNPYGRGY